MGVKTSVWGKYAWIVLESIASLYDQYMLDDTKTSDQRTHMKDLMTQFMFLIGEVVPCVYCRISYQLFTNPMDPKNKGVNIKHMLSVPKNGAKKLIYNIHNQVNYKLQGQERKKYKHNPKKLRAINVKWSKYIPTFEKALQTRYVSTSSKRFWYALICFLALIMCDFRPAESFYIYRFVWTIGKILLLSSCSNTLLMAHHFLNGLEKSLPSWHCHMTFDDRLDVVWLLKKQVFDVADVYRFDHNRQSFKQQCLKAIVGCQ